MQRITPHLWFDKEAKEAAEFYACVFPKSKIKDITTLHDTPSGTVDVVTIELLGQEFMMISAGPLFKFNEAISFIVHCDTQEEIDYYWEKLSEDREKYKAEKERIADEVIEILDRRWPGFKQDGTVGFCVDTKRGFLYGMSEPSAYFEGFPPDWPPELRVKWLARFWARLL